MAVTATPAYPQSVQNWILQLTPTQTTTSTLFITAGTNGTKVELINVTSTDTTARDVIVNIFNSSTNYQISQISIPITAGTINSTPSVNLLTNSQFASLPRDTNGNPYIYLASGYNLYIAMGTTITTAKVVTLIAHGVNF